MNCSLYKVQFNGTNDFEANAPINDSTIENCQHIRLNSTVSGTVKNVKITGSICGVSADNKKIITAIPAVDYVQEFTPVGKTVTEVA